MWLQAGVSWGHPGLHFGCSGGRLGTFFDALGVLWGPIWRLWGTLDLHFGSFGGPLGSILKALVAFGGAWGHPWPPKGPKSPIVLVVSLPFWELFGYILEVKNDQKSDIIFD